MIADAMDLVHENSISAIALLQSRFQEQSTLMFMISNLFDPRYAFLFYAPLLYSLDRYTGRKIMWVAVIAEWSNQILKWILHGERPYWWIHETPVYSNTTLPDVQQFKVTCETGPGSPSGHAMVTASVWYILIEALLKRQSSESKGNIFSKIAWAIYTIILAAVSLSRIYIAAHFPHQCVLGGIIGVAVAILVSNLNTDHMSRRAYIMGSLGLFLSAMTTYAALRMFGMNPMWSVDRALKWCAKREYVHLDTTPFFSMMRYVGFFLGMGIGLTSPYTYYVSKVNFNMTAKIVCAILAVGLCKLYELIKLPMYSTLVFYSMAMASHAILAYILVALVPYFVARISSLKVKSN